METEPDIEYLKDIYKTKEVDIIVSKIIKTGQIVCIKRYKLVTEQNFVQINNELSLLYSIKHPSILRILGHKFYASNVVELVLEYCSKGDLCDEINRRLKNNNLFTELEVLNNMKDLISGFAYLQEQKIVHRDVKPDNILVTEEGKCKISDLGGSKRIIYRTSKTITGTAYYMSPELRTLQSKGFVENYDEKIDPYKSDVWSLALTFLVMASSKSAEDFNDLKNIPYVKVNRLNSITNIYIKEALTHMLEEEINKRPDFILLNQIFLRIYNIATLCFSCGLFTETPLWCRYTYKAYHPSCLVQYNYNCLCCHKPHYASVTCTKCETYINPVSMKQCNHFLCESCKLNSECEFCIDIFFTETPSQVDKNWLNSIEEYKKIWCHNCRSPLEHENPRKLTCKNCKEAYCSICKNQEHKGACFQEKFQYEVLCRCLMWRLKQPDSLFIECPLCFYVCVVCYKSAGVSHSNCSCLYSATVIEDRNKSISYL